MSSTERDKALFDIQEKQYEFPYHHLPHFHKEKPTRMRTLYWGTHYLCSKRDMKETVEGWNPGSVLEIGCGDGAMIGELNKNIKRVGVDLSKRAIGFASSFYPDIDFRAIDAANVEGQFDVVMAVEVLEHIPDAEISQFMRTAISKTKVGGKLYITVPHKNMPLIPKHHRHYDGDLLKKHIDSALIQVKYLNVRPFYNGVSWEKAYRRLTNNRLIVSEIPYIENLIWKQCWASARSPAAHKAHQMIAEIERL